MNVSGELVVWKSEEHYAEVWANEDDHKKVVKRYVRGALG